MTYHSQWNLAFHLMQLYHLNREAEDKTFCIVMMERLQDVIDCCASKLVGPDDFYSFLNGVVTISMFWP